MQSSFHWMFTLSVPRSVERFVPFFAPMLAKTGSTVPQRPMVARLIRIVTQP